MRASVIVPCAGDLTELPETVAGLRAQDADIEWEVVFVDNGLAPFARRLLQQQADTLPHARIIDEPRHGIGPARNAGARAADGEVIAFVDADDVPVATWLSTLVDTVDYGVIASGALDLTRLNPPWLASTRGDHRPGDLYWCEGVFPVAPGGNMALRRADFWAIGGFAPDQRTLEDFDFALRAWEKGVTVRAAGMRATVLYRLRGSARALFRQGYRYGRARSDVYSQLWERRLVRRWSFSGWKSWVLLLAYLPAAIASGRKRLALCWIAGNRLGRLSGSLARRVVYL